MKRETIQNLIASANIKGALETLLSAVEEGEQSNILQLQNTYRQLEKEQMLGIIPRTEYTLRLNQIVQETLDYCGRLPTSTDISQWN